MAKYEIINKSNYCFKIAFLDDKDLMVGDGLYDLEWNSALRYPSTTAGGGDFIPWQRLYVLVPSTINLALNFNENGARVLKHRFYNQYLNNKDGIFDLHIYEFYPRLVPTAEDEAETIIVTAQPDDVDVEDPPPPPKPPTS